MTVATFTELLRHPKEVAAQADEGAVRISRRDAADLVLVRAGEYDAQFEGVALASQIMRASLRNHGDVSTALKDTFAWVSLLSPRGQKQFSSQIERLIWSATELGTYGELLNTFRSWQGTAEAIADGMSADDDLDWIEPASRTNVERP